MKGYLKAFAYGLCHCEARIGVSLNQSLGMMKGCLKAFANKLTDCFVPRNDKTENFYLPRYWNNEMTDVTQA
jgi:hypothetical protein